MALAKFDFKAFNELNKSANTGLRMHLAKQLLQEVETSMRRFQSPLAKEMIDLVDELNDLINRNKDYLSKKEKSN
jgi:methionyl-tRNA synthetase